MHSCSCTWDMYDINKNLTFEDVLDFHTAPYLNPRRASLAAVFPWVIQKYDLSEVMRMLPNHI